MKSLIQKIFRPHSLIVTILIFTFIWLLDTIRLNLHVLDPFNYGLKDYEIFDIFYSRWGTYDRDPHESIVLVDLGTPDRAEMAKLINRIAEGNPRVIGLDVLLIEKDHDATDTLLQESLRRADNVVLATALGAWDQTNGQFSVGSGVDTFFSNYAAAGFYNFPIADRNQTVRHFSPRAQTNQGEVYSFPVEIVEKYDQKAAARLHQRDRPLERIHYTTVNERFPELSQKNILEEDLDLSAIIEDKIILIGYLGHDRFGDSMTDRYYTPLNERYSGHAPPDMAGIAIHANIISMVLKNNHLYEAPTWLRRLLAFLFCYANVVLIHWIYSRFHEAFHGITRAVQLFECLILFFLLGALFYRFQIRLDFTSGILAMVLAYDFVMIYESLILKKFPALRKIPVTYSNKHMKQALPRSE